MYFVFHLFTIVSIQFRLAIFFVYDNENEDRDLCRPIREGEVVPIELHY